jgi:ubiquinone/menaquinone biosynthesis C-methylase UbiE
MSYLFDPKKKEKLDNPERRKMMPPVNTLERLGLEAGDRMADLGCGIGYFSIPAASIAKVVHAFDISEEMINELAREKEEREIENLILHHTDPKAISLPDASVNFILVVNVLHEVPVLEDYIAEMMRVLCSGGRLGIVDFIKAETKQGPPVKHRIDADHLIDLLEPYGVESIERFEIGDSLYGLKIRMKGSDRG